MNPSASDHVGAPSINTTVRKGDSTVNTMHATTIINTHHNHYTYNHYYKECLKCKSAAALDTEDEDPAHRISHLMLDYLKLLVTDPHTDSTFLQFCSAPLSTAAAHGDVDTVQAISRAKEADLRDAAERIHGLAMHALGVRGLMPLPLTPTPDGRHQIAPMDSEDVFLDKDEDRDEDELRRASEARLARFRRGDFGPTPEKQKRRKA